jgi:hypothetical protein
VSSGETKIELFWMGDRLREGEADTRDLRCMDKGTHFETGVRGRPGGEDGETVFHADDGETGGNSNETGLG